MKYALCEWERNGYDDSDFFVAEWDTEERTVTKREIGSTRYAGGIAGYTPVSDPAMVRDAQAWLVERMALLIANRDRENVLEPNDAPNGTCLRLLRDVRHKGIKYAAGTVGVSFWCGAFGKFYRNGYNRPNRFNLRVGIRTADGRSFFAALEACRLDREQEGEDVNRERAERQAARPNFTAFFGGAWATHDYAAAVIEQGAKIAC